MGWFTKLFKQEVSEAPPTTEYQEEAWQANTFFGKNSGKFEAYNPDQLTARKGHDIYNRMLLDPQIHSAFNLVVDILISRKYRFEPQGDNEQLQQEIESFFRYNINTAMRGTFLQAMRTILLAKAQGYSISEKVFAVDQFEGKDLWVCCGVKAKPYHTFTFERDVYGNVTRVFQEQGSKRKVLNPDKFIIMVNNPEHDPIYGRSDLRAIYKPFWAKQNVEKLWNIWLEKMAGGMIIAQPGENATILSAQEKTDLRNVLKNASQSTSMVAPMGYEINLESMSNTDAYKESLEYQNKEIAKGLLVPNLLGFSEQGQHGALSQSKVQLETFYTVINRQGDYLADILNEQFFSQLSIWNYGTREFPKFTFEHLTDDSKRTIAEAWTLAVEKGIVTNRFEDENRTRELLQYDIITEEERLEEEPEPDPEPGEDDVEEDPQEDPQVEAKENREADSTETKRNFEEVLPEEETTSKKPWIDRVDFAGVEAMVKGNEKAFFEELAIDIDNIFTQVRMATATILNKIAADRDKYNLEEEIETIDGSISPESKSELRTTIKNYLRVSYNDGRATAQEELNKAVKKVESLELKEKLRIGVACVSKLATKFNEGKWTIANFVEGINLSTAEQYFSAAAFWLTGDLTNEMVDTAKRIILNGIRDELSIPEMLIELEDALAPLIGKREEETGEINKLTRPRLETIVRTNLTDAFNQAQLSTYTDNELGDFVEALEYTSILDSRTTAICRNLDGNIYSIKDPIWQSITPPNHFNCRARTMPITAVDQWTASAKPPSNIQPEKGFGTIKPIDGSISVGDPRTVR